LTVNNRCLKCTLQVWNGDIDTTDFAKIYWQDELRATVLRVFDVTVVHWADHPKERVNSVYDMMASEWEYEGGDFDMKKFGVWCCGCLKRERTKLRRYFDKVCKSRRDKAGPPNMAPEKWGTLVDIWTSPEGLAKSKRMKDTRSCVTDLSRCGRGGIAAIQSRVVSAQYLWIW
jgi:hypothetical protein